MLNLLLKNNSQCPECSGALRARADMSLWCIDCHTVYVPVSEGVSDTELGYKKQDGRCIDSGENTE